LEPVAVVKDDISGVTREAPGTGRIDLLGPEGIVGLEPGQISGRFPVPGSAGSEAINLAAVEFGATDMPWRFSPARAGAAQRLRPWLVLIVTPVSVGIAAGSPLPTITVPVRMLPDLAESWAWAHVHLDDPASGAGRSRVLCPLKLPPDTTLQAAVVPAFRGGVQSGLGRAVDQATAHAPAWTLDQPNDAVLPVYDYWQFATGQDADFEFLARRIRPARQDMLGAFGFRQIDITAPWPGGDPLANHPVTIAVGGALRPLSHPQAGTATSADLTTFSGLIVADIAATADGDLGPPLRGGPHAARTIITSTGGDWLDEANRDPSHRMAAARGTDWVMANQEELMAAAWSQAGQIRDAAHRLSLSRAAAAITESLQARHVDTLTPDELVAVTAPAAGRARLGSTAEEPTLHAALRSTALPDGLATTALARFTRRAAGVGRATQATTLITRAAGGAMSHALATGAPSAQLAAVVYAKPMPAGATDPISTGVTTARISAAAAAATSLWVASKVAKTQGAAIATTFTKVLAAQPNFIDGPSSVSPTLAADAVRKSVALAITHDQLAVPGPDSPAGDGVSIRPDGLLIGAPAVGQLVRSSFDAVAAVRRRFAATIECDGAPVADLDPVLPSPDVPVPMARAMIDRDPEWFLPGIGDFPQDRSTLLGTDDSFVESVVLGANTELLAEFLWREFPTDRRGTPIRRFWPRADNAPDIDPIHQWAGALGSHTTIKQAETTVILIRAELFVRYPNTVVLAAQAEADPVHPNHLRPEGTLDHWQQPLFTLGIDASTRAIGFNIRRAEVLAPVSAVAPGWFFVLVEPPTSIRFGFDLATDPPAANPAPPPPATWNDLTWDHVIDDRGFATARRPIALPPPVLPLLPQWGGAAASAADVARIALQRPVRVALHASTMVTSQE
jgi:hypothetical protein